MDGPFIHRINCDAVMLWVEKRDILSINVMFFRTGNRNSNLSQISIMVDLGCVEKSEVPL